MQLPAGDKSPGDVLLPPQYDANIARSCWLEAAVIDSLLVDIELN